MLFWRTVFDRPRQLRALRAVVSLKRYIVMLSFLCCYCTIHSYVKFFGGVLFVGINAAHALLLRVRHTCVPIVGGEDACGSVLRLQDEHVNRVYILAPHGGCVWSCTYEQYKTVLVVRPQSAEVRERNHWLSPTRTHMRLNMSLRMVRSVPCARFNR